MSGSKSSKASRTRHMPAAAEYGTSSAAGLAPEPVPAPIETGPAPTETVENNATISADSTSQPEATIDTQQIANLAYSYWEARGCQGGSPEEDWLRAEHELRSRTLVLTA